MKGKLGENNLVANFLLDRKTAYERSCSISEWDCATADFSSDDRERSSAEEKSSSFSFCNNSQHSFNV
jgi:hypothetical protein